MANSISKIKIPSGTVYEVKDDTSRGGITDLRSKIDNLNSVVGASIERREGSATSTYGGTVTILSGIRLKANGAYKMTATLNRSISDQPVAVELKKSDGTVYQSVTIPVGETTTESAMFGNIGNTDLENCYVTFRNPSGLVNSLTCTVVIDTAVAKPVDNISKKLDKPSTEGTAGQVVASDGNGGTEWVNMVEVSAEATQLPEGSSPTVTSALVGGAPKLTFGIPAGATGAPGAKGDRGDTIIIAKDYADLTFPVYAGKTYCYYDNKPYVANTDIATTEAWTAAHWDEVSFEDEISDLKSAINNIDNVLNENVITSRNYELTSPEEIVVPPSVFKQNVAFLITGETEDAKIITNKANILLPYVAVGGINRFSKESVFANITGSVYVMFHVSSIAEGKALGITGSPTAVYNETGEAVSNRTITSPGWYYLTSSDGFSTGYATAGNWTIDHFVGVDSTELATRYPDITWDATTFINNFPATKYGAIAPGDSYTPQTVPGSITIMHDGTGATYTGETVIVPVYPGDLISSNVGTVEFELQFANLVKTVNGISPDNNGNIDLGSLIEIDNTLTQAGKAADAKATGDAISELEEEVISKTNYILTAGQSMTVEDGIKTQNVNLSIDDYAEPIKVITNVGRASFDLPFVSDKVWFALNKDGSGNEGHDVLANVTGIAYVWIHFSELLSPCTFYNATTVVTESGVDVSSPISVTGWYAIKNNNNNITFNFGYDAQRGYTIDKIVVIDSASLEEDYPETTWDLQAFVENFPPNIYGNIGFGETSPSSHVTSGNISITHNQIETVYDEDTVVQLSAGDVISIVGGQVSFVLKTGMTYVKTVNGTMPDPTGNISLDCVSKVEAGKMLIVQSKNSNLHLKGVATDAVLNGLTPSVGDAYVYSTDKVHGLYKTIVRDGDIIWWNGSEWETLRKTPSTFDNYENERVYDVVIVGGGAGGIGAAYALKDSGYKICLIERLDSLGGTHVNAGVSSLLSSPSPDFLRQVYKSVYNSGHYVTFSNNHKYGPATDDEFDRLWRGGTISVGGLRQNAVDFNPWAISKKYYDDLVSSGVDVLLGTSFVSSTVTNGVVENIVVKNNHTGKEEKIWGLYFIDSTSFADVCVYGKTEGTDYYIGTDSRARFNESAIDENYVAEPGVVNSAEADYMYEVTPGVTHTAPKCKNTDTFYAAQARWLFPNELGKEIRVLSTDGSDRCARYIFDPAHKRGYDYAMFQADNRTKDHFKKAFGESSEQRYICKMPMMGFRETNRVACENMLVQDDLTVLATSQNYVTNRYVALASWNIDLHTKRGIVTENLPTPKELVGLPYESIIPVAYKNMLVASKCFGSSHIALSYFRLTKSCISIGWAAGCAIKTAMDSGYLDDLRDVDINDLQTAIGIGGLIDDIETYFTLT